MQVGVGLPVSGKFASTEGIAQVARLADELDFAAVWTFERIIRPVASIPSWDGTLAPMPEAVTRELDRVFLGE